MRWTMLLISRLTRQLIREAFRARKAMKVNVLIALLVLAIVGESREIRRRKKLLDQVADYEASGDYFEVTVSASDRERVVDETMVTNKNRIREESTTTAGDTTSSPSSDDGVTCSASNFTDIYAGYELESHVLVIFKVNVSANERELVL